MGHYRSEMGFEEEDRRAAEQREQRIADLTRVFEDAITRKGIARVLAEFVRQNSTGGYCYLNYTPRD